MDFGLAQKVGEKKKKKIGKIAQNRVSGPFSYFSANFSDFLGRPKPIFFLFLFLFPISGRRTERGRNSKFWFQLPWFCPISR